MKRATRAGRKIERVDECLEVYIVFCTFGQRRRYRWVIIWNWVDFVLSSELRVPFSKILMYCRVLFQQRSVNSFYHLAWTIISVF